MIQKPFIIGISGGSGSGKTTFVKELANNFSKDQVCILSQDNYYKPKLLNGEDVVLKEYVYNNPLAEPKLITYKPAPIIIIEGIFVFHFLDVSNLMDFKIFIDADEHIKLIRRIQRDQIERNYPLEDVLYRYQHHVFPSYQKFILPYKPHCDIVVNNNVSFEIAMNTVKLTIKEKLDSLK